MLAVAQDFAGSEGYRPQCDGLAMRQLVDYGKMQASDCLLVDMGSESNTLSWLAITWQHLMLARCLIRQGGLLAAGPACH